jgi:hypothetical protein
MFFALDRILLKAATASPAVSDLPSPDRQALAASSSPDASTDYMARIAAGDPGIAAGTSPRWRLWRGARTRPRPRSTG